MARTINRGTGARGGRGGGRKGYGRGRGGYGGKGRGGGRGGRQGVLWTRKANECTTPCHNPLNNDLRDRYQKYYEYICAINEETRQEPGTYLKVLKGLYYHAERVHTYDTALAVKGVGPMHAKKCASALRWREFLDAQIIAVPRGRWAAPPKDTPDAKPRWWRVEVVEIPSSGNCMARRQWGLTGEAGYDEDFTDFPARAACDRDLTKWVRSKEREGYVRSAAGDDDSADHVEAPDDDEVEEARPAPAPRALKAKYAPRFLDKDTGSLSGVCALLVALHRHSPLDKTALAQEAQRHTRVAMAPNPQQGQFYGAIKSLGTLEKNNIVEPVPNDVRRFRLTTEAGAGLVAGDVLARAIDERYRAELEYTPPTERTRPRDDDEAPMGPKKRRSCLERLRNDVDGAKPFLDVYDVTLYVDSREKTKNDKHEADAIVGRLLQTENTIAVRKASLQVGDYLFIATPKNEQPYDGFWRDRGVVVGPCLERKCASDFHSTVKGKSHHRKQTLALSRCGVPASYIIEGDVDALDVAALDRQALHDEMARLEVELGFTVHRSPSFDHTVRYLQGLDAYLKSDLRAKTVDDVLASGVAAYRDVVASLGISEKDWDLRARFGTFLLHVPGVKKEYVGHILAKYPTFALLKRALDSHGLEEPLLARIIVPGARRRADAKKIADFFVQRDYPAAG